MSIYVLDTDYIGEQLTPPKLRNIKMLSWLKVLLKPLSNLFNINFLKYKLGETSSDFNISSNYYFGERVIWTDKRIYEQTHLPITTITGIYPDNSDYWTPILDNFIGSDERIKYNAQKMLFEYALNRFFRIPITDPQIYIVNQTTFITPFVMGNSGTYSSSMPINSINQINYLGNAYTYTSFSYDYEIYVPIAVYNTLGTDATNKENAIRNFADLYNLAGMSFSVLTYP